MKKFLALLWMPEVGVINEQGFVAGLGLGYTPTDLGKSGEDKKNEEKQGA